MVRVRLPLPFILHARSSFFSASDQQISGILHQADGETAVVIAHGYGGSKEGHGQIYVQLAEQLAKEGISTLRFDFRPFKILSIESLKEDLRAATKWMKGKYTRVGLLGVSLGGSIATLVANEVDAVCLAVWNPVADGALAKQEWQELYTDAEIRELLKRGGESPSPQFLEQLAQMRPLDHLGDLPLLHVQSGQDEAVPASHTALYKAARPDADYLLLPTSDHRFTNAPDERALLLTHTASWFVDHLV